MKDAPTAKRTSFQTTTAPQPNLAADPLPLLHLLHYPSTARYDRFTKRRLYQEVRIPCYWIVDTEKELVEVWTPELEFPRIEDEQATWQPSGAGGPLTVRLENLFEPL